MIEKYLVFTILNKNYIYYRCQIIAIYFIIITYIFFDGTIFFKTWFKFTVSNYLST